jgi:PAS domain S-box-containing protein
MPSDPTSDSAASPAAPDAHRLHGALARSLKVAVIATDLAGAVTFWNPFATELYGWTSQEVLGRNIMEITVTSETEDEARQHMAAVMAGGTWAGEFQVRCKNGTYVAAFVTLSALVDRQGINIGVVGVSEDLTLRRNAEEALRRSESQFNAFANSLPELCWMAQPDGHIFWYNDRWYEYTGTSPEQMQGWGWQSVHDPEILPTVMERWKSSLDTGKPFEMEFPLLGADGTFRWFLTRIRPLHDAAGNVVRWYGTNTNVDEQRRLFESLTEARDHLEKRVQERTVELNTANESLRQLSIHLLRMRDDEQRRLARELHDSVGQLLAAISMNIDIVSTESSKLSAAAAKCVAENAGLVKEVSREIRTISHLLHPPLLDEAGLASALRWYVEGFAERSKIKVELEIPDNFGRLPHDMEIAVFRIIQECLTNIHRHSESVEAAICIHRAGDRLFVKVEDKGIGIPAEKQHELNAFGRGGVGFGGMRERLRQLGGSLEILSDGKGTAVSATLPLVTSALATSIKSA